ncbi:MAG: hypothetical protein K9J13_09305 [Saprospiraceae bacterium]|nr:hypothetical protein [Saprospiraceae bacterium]
MKKIFFIFLGLIIFMQFAFINIEPISKHNKQVLQSACNMNIEEESGGSWIYEEDWTGFFDPESGMQFEPDATYFKEPPNKKGEFVYQDDIKIGIVCPSAGTNCGNFFKIEGPNSKINCGLYLTN